MESWVRINEGGLAKIVKATTYTQLSHIQTILDRTYLAIMRKKRSFTKMFTALKAECASDLFKAESGSWLSPKQTDIKEVYISLCHKNCNFALKKSFHCKCKNKNKYMSFKRKNKNQY